MVVVRDWRHGARLLSSAVQCGLARRHFDDAGEAILGGAFSSFCGQGTGSSLLLSGLSDEFVLGDLHLMGVELGLNLIMILRPHLRIHRCRVIRHTAGCGLQGWDGVHL